jgi:translation initiation factor IF-2
MARVYDLAMAFRLTTKEVLDRLHAGGIEALTFSSAVDEEQARAILSQPVARIPAHMIRPGTTAPPKAPARRPARIKTPAVPAEDGAAVPAKRPARAKPATEPDGKDEAKPRPPRRRVAAPAAPAAKPLVVTLEMATVESAVVIPAPAPPSVATPVEVAAAPPAPPAAKPPAPPEAKEPPRPVVEPPRPVVEPPRPVVEPPRPVVEPPRPVIAPPRPVTPQVPVPPRPSGRYAKPAPPPAPPPAPSVPPTPKILRVGYNMTPKELAEKMSATPSDVIKRLIKLGILVTINTPIDAETVGKIAPQFGFTVEQATPEELVEEATAVLEAPELLKPRAPVVTVMGHVDHGKTSLLDAIRHTNVIATEAGGITQHIGAYEVEVSSGHAVNRVVFLDTPGHEAFTAMRARGAQATDIVVLVVAADDGVMPQTVEAINHAKDAKVPILVAVNKIDRPDADPNRVKQQLTEYGLLAEEWGGETIFVPVSAKRREGIQELLDNLLILAEIQELKANPDKPARGLVVEAELDKGRGPVATVLVQTGSLRVGDAVVAGLHHGKIRAMLNDKGKKIHEAGPATPVVILGLSGVPSAGDTFAAVGDERKARQIATARQDTARQEAMVSQPRITLDALHQQIERGEVKELRMIIKGDVQGSMEPLRDSLERLSTERVHILVIHSSVGAVTESDVMLAAASNAIILGFNVRPEPKAQKLAEHEHVDLRMYSVIYEAITQVRAAMEGLLEPTYVERMLGRVEVRQVFNITKVGTVAGSYVVDGKVLRDATVRLVRDGRVVHTGKISSLRRFKDDAREVLSGQECGIGLANYNDVHAGDVLEIFEVDEIAPKL